MSYYQPSICLKLGGASGLVYLFSLLVEALTNSAASVVQSYLVRYTSPQLLIEPFIHTAQISNWLYMPIVKWRLLLL